MNTKDYIPERRPLGARNWSASHAVARWLAEHGVSPNVISIGGFVASLGAGSALAASGVSDRPAAWQVIGCAFILVRGMCNMLDGMVAVSTGRASRGGELFNEVPDRLSDAVTLVGAGYAAGSVPELGYIAAVAAVFTAYVRVQGCALGTSADFGGPMAKTHRMFAIVAAALYTAIVPAAWQTMLAGGGQAGAMAFALCVVIVGCVLTSMRRLVRCHRLLGEEPS